MKGNNAAFNEVVTLKQAKKLIQCMAHEQSFLLLSAPGIGKSEMVYEAAQEAGLPCRSLLGTQIAPEDVSGVPRIVGERSVLGAAGAAKAIDEWRRGTTEGIRGSGGGAPRKSLRIRSRRCERSIHSARSACLDSAA